MAKRPRKRRIPVRFRLTVGGWVFLTISLLLGVAAVKSQVALMFVLFGGMMGVLHISAITARGMVGAVEVRREVPRRAWQYQTVPLGYHLRNARRRGSCLSLLLEEDAPVGIDSVAGYCVHLPASSGFRSGGRFAARRRGRVSLRGVRLETSFPFGLVRASRLIPTAASVVIWPARGRLRGRLLHQGAVESSSAAPSRASGGQDEFFGLREYRPGDNPRWIHWRRSATKPTPVVREMAHPLPEILWVILDTRLAELSEMAERLREVMLRFSATLVDHAFARGYQVGVALAYSDRVAAHAPAAGRGHRRTVLDALADVDTNVDHPIRQVLAAVSPGRLRQAMVVLITPDARRVDAGVAGQVRRACRHLTVITERELPHVFEDVSAGIEAKREAG